MTRAPIIRTVPLVASPLLPWEGSGWPISAALRADPASRPIITPHEAAARPQPSHWTHGSGGQEQNRHDAPATPDTFSAGSQPEWSMEDFSSVACAINCKSEATPRAEDLLTDEAADLLRASIAPASARALRGDLDQFQAWGGTLPATPAMITRYIAEHSEQHAVATIQRRLASIAKAHDMAGLPNPCRAEIVKATLRGLRRVKGTAQRQATPLLRDDLFLVLDSMGDSLRDQRDRALLLLGFAGGFRRSELVALDVADIQAVREGLIVTIRRSKTDQEGAGRRIGIPHGRTRHCPVKAVEGWLASAGIEEGPVFRPITRHGALADTRLSGDAVSVLIRERVAAAGIDPEGFSGHSLRAGFATSAAQAGVSTLKIRAQTGHASDGMLARYVREGDMFTGNAAGAVL